ncbi:MAG: G5 domain-containing protein [Acutalibacteraceae bacterium]
MDKAGFIRSRKGASMFLAAACLISFTFISSNLSAVEVIDGNNKQTVISTKASNKVGIINQAGFALAEDDSYAVSASDESDIIKILRAFDITVVDGGVEKVISAVDGSVESALTNAGIELPDADDEINCALTDNVTENMVVDIDRVEYVTSTVTKAVKYKTVTKNDSTLASGKTKVSVEGVNGTKEVTTTKKLVNGKVVDTKVTEKVVKKAVDKVVLKGTKGSSSNKGGKYTVDTGSKTLVINGKTVKYSKLLTGSGTAYTAPKGAKTATGKPAQVGLVAVNPKIIPYGTKLYIVSADGKYNYGYAIAADTGSALRNGSALVDLYYNTERECVQFGRRQVKVYILG